MLDDRNPEGGKKMLVMDLDLALLTPFGACRALRTYEERFTMATAGTMLAAT